jgi:DNA-binding NarL/FixJ family response regulator
MRTALSENILSTDLTPRLLSVASLIVNEAVSNKEIAGRLGISEGTVKQYTHQIFKRFGVSSRLELFKIYWKTMGKRGSFYETSDTSRHDGEYEGECTS